MTTIQVSSETPDITVLNEQVIIEVGAQQGPSGPVGPAGAPGTTLPPYTLANVGQVLGVINQGGVATLAWVNQTGGGTYTPSLDFSDARNSQYIAVIF